MSERPRIAMTACLMHEDPERRIFKGKALQYSEQKMARAVWRAGALPIQLLDLREREALEQAIACCDGLVLQGGADVAPGSYGETPLRPEWAGDAIRDAHEIAAIEVAVALGKPVLGVCRGAQVLNVALGGTLYQDINTQVEGSLVHRDWQRYEIIEHPITLERGSWLAEVYGDRELLINTVHHQAIKDLAGQLRVTARAPDGIIEGVEDIADDRWLVGVQWHPEWLDGSVEGGAHRTAGGPVFEAFVRECRARRR
jgi:putative glutamine amidotransferase